MKISQIIVNESDVGTTTSGGIATVSETLGKVNVRGLEPAEKVMKGKAKKKGPYANSLSEGKKMAEARVDEEDKIIAPGVGRKLKPGFFKHDPDKAEHEGETLKNSLHTIIRVATALDKQLSTRDNFPEWVSEKIGATKGMMVAVAEYLQSAKEMKRDPDAMDEGAGVIAGGEQYEGQQWPDTSNSLAKRSAVATNLKGAPTKAGRGSGMTVATRVDPTITPTTVKRKDSDKPIPKFLQKESQLDELSKDTLRSYVKKQPERIKGQQGLARTNPNKAERIVDPKKGDIRKALNKLKDPKYGNAEPSMGEGAKVDRMVKNIEKSEKKLGHSKKEAENIAWATANKRGMLDNKNKKK